MTRINSKDARSSFKQLLDAVAAGEEVVILRRGKEVARLVPPRRVRHSLLPSLRALRQSLSKSAPPLSDAVIANRQEQRD